MATKFLNVRKLIFLTLFGFFVFYAFLAGPYWMALFKYRSVSQSGVGYVVPGQRTELPTEETTTLKPVSDKFGLVVPRVAINKSVAKQVDLYEEERLINLLDGSLAHLAGSSRPNRLGPVVILGHPLSQLLNFRHLNPELYLLDKLEVGDPVFVFYEGTQYMYKVSANGVHSPTYFDFFDANRERKLYLVSGWPPGTSLRLFVVEAEATWD